MKYGVLRVKFLENLQWTIEKYDNKGILNFIINRRKFL